MPQRPDGGWRLDDSELILDRYGAAGKGSKIDGAMTHEQTAALPDSSFAYVEPGGVTKDEGGVVRTVPASLRHLAYKGADGAVDPEMLALALKNVDQANLPRIVRERAKAKLQGVCEGIGAAATTPVEKYITNEGGKWQVRAESGKVLGEHGSKAEAAAQLAAVEANKQPKAKAEREPGSEVQALTFEKKLYKEAQEASDWANDHGYAHGPVSDAGHGWRIEQAAVGKYARLQTIELTAGVSAVVGVPREAVKALQDAFAKYAEVKKIVVKAADVAVEGVEESSLGTVWKVQFGDSSAHFAQEGSVAVHLPHYLALSGDGFVPVMKAEEQKYTLGVVYACKEVDFHGDTMTPEELEKTAWAFLGKDGASSRVGLQHRPGTAGAGKVVESYIYRGPKWTQKAADGKSQEQIVEPGDWLMGVVWNDEGWDAVKSGKVTGYSLQGVARKEAVL